MHARKSNNAHKAADKRQPAGKKRCSSSFHISRLPLAPYFPFYSIPALLITDSTRKAALRRVADPLRGKESERAIAEICGRR